MHIEKWDKRSGWPNGDRDRVEDALNIQGDTEIVFTVTNTSDSKDGHGAVFKASDLKITDVTLDGDGTVEDFRYPDGWSSLVLRPGEHVDVIGVLKGVTARHTNRAKVTGTPLVEVPNDDANPWNESLKDDRGADNGNKGSTPTIPGGGENASNKSTGDDSSSAGASSKSDVDTGSQPSSAVGGTKDSLKIDGRIMESMPPVTSNLDDWNGLHVQGQSIMPSLANTGASVMLQLLIAGAFLFGALLLEVFKRDCHHPKHR